MRALSLPRYPTPDAPTSTAPVGPIPVTVTVASVLLGVNLVLSVLVTVLSLTHVDDLLRLAVANHRAGTAPVTRQTVQDGLYVRGGVNVAIGVFYFFLITRLRRGSWWAWRRMIFVSIAGALGIVYLLTQPYTAIFKVEQALQLVVLVGIGVCVLHPQTRAFIGPRRRRRRLGRRGESRA